MGEAHVEGNMAPLATRALLAGLGGAVGGAAAMMATSVAGAIVLWKQFHIATAPQSWIEVAIVSLTNGLWMMIEGATTGIWLTVWASLRGGSSRTRIVAILAFVVGVMSSQELPGLIIEVTRHRYVVLLHEAFSLILGSIGLWDVTPGVSARRVRGVAWQAVACGLAMSVLLCAIGNGPEIVVANWFLYGVTAGGILFGALLGQAAADRPWRVRAATESPLLD